MDLGKPLHPAASASHPLPSLREHSPFSRGSTPMWIHQPCLDLPPIPPPTPNSESLWLSTDVPSLLPPGWALGGEQIHLVRRRICSCSQDVPHCGQWLMLGGEVKPTRSKVRRLRPYPGSQCKHSSACSHP